MRAAGGRPSSKSSLEAEFRKALAADLGFTVRQARKGLPQNDPQLGLIKKVLNQLKYLMRQTDSPAKKLSLTELIPSPTSSVLDFLPAPRAPNVMDFPALDRFVGRLLADQQKALSEANSLLTAQREK